MCNDLYDRHASDPLSAPWFGADKEWNIRTAEQVKENVFTFFSSGIGGTCTMTNQQPPRSPQVNHRDRG